MSNATNDTLASLREQVRLESERRDAIRQGLKNLAMEYAQEMQALGVEPYTVVDATGEYVDRDYSAEGIFDGPGEHTIVMCKSLGIMAWPVYAPSPYGFSPSGRDLIMTVSVQGFPVFTEETQLDGYVDRSREDVIFLAPDVPKGKLLVYKSADYKPSRGYEGLDRPQSWLPARRVRNSIELLRLYEQAYTNGVAAVLDSFTQTMLLHIDNYRSH